MAFPLVGRYGWMLWCLSVEYLLELGGLIMTPSAQLRELLRTSEPFNLKIIGLNPQ